MSDISNLQGKTVSHLPGEGRPEDKTPARSLHRPAVPEGGRTQGLRMFAAQQILPRLEALSKEIDGVKAGDDIEYLHRMRVASRRLRAALPVFESCFPPKKYARWLADIRRITRVLGDARDADVQIAALRKYRKKILKKQEGAPGGEPRGADPRIEGIGYLLSKTRDRRAEYQKEITSALTDLEKHQTIEEIRQSVLTGFALPGSPRKNVRQIGVPPMGVSYIGKQMENLLGYSHWVQYPDAVAEHHAMRIEAKQLRYMMELFSPVYRRGLRRQISQVAKLQEILGELHDCDVWIDRVTYLLLRERTKPRLLRDSNRPGPLVISGLKQFLNDREKERRAIYRRFVRFWDSLGRVGFWQQIRSDVVAGVRAEFSVPGDIPDDATIRAVQDLAQVFPPGLAHANHVKELAAALFGSLQEIHAMDSRSGLLLESAAMLHDIGCVSGRKKHPHRSAAMILSDDRLPFGIRERGIIALAAGAHRGRLTISSTGIFGVLTPADQHRALLIASLLRMADGLDIRHNGIVSSIACGISGRTITCTISAVSDAGPEQQKTLAKADLFMQVSGYTVVFSSPDRTVVSPQDRRDQSGGQTQPVP